MRMKNEEEPDKPFSLPNSSFFIFLRGFVPLLLVVLAVLVGPTLIVWWLHGGALRLSDALIGGAVSLTLLLGAGLAFGWAVGRLGRGRRG
jgi:uncharacterized BrkB/YihY/UPF0761 family membrane protein